MKKGLSIVALAEELERQQLAKKDYHADRRRLSMKAVDNGQVILEGVNGGMKVRPIAHAQLAGQLGIPKVYYDKLLAEKPDLLARNVNEWLHNAKPLVDGSKTKETTVKLVRTIDNEVRAVLSDSYRPLDNHDLAVAVIPKLIDMKAEVMDSQITENRMYIKAVTDRIKGQPKVGDVIHAGIIVSNSEVGQGSLSVSALDFRLQCLNGMVRAAEIRKAHLGRGNRGQDIIEDSREYFRDETRQLDDRAFFAKVQDVTSSMFDQVRFDARIKEYADAAGRQIEGDIIKVVEVTAKRFGFNEGEKSSILQHLIRGNDQSVWGMANAVTRAAQDVESYDRSVELEQIGGVIVLAPVTDFKVN